MSGGGGGGGGYQQDNSLAIAQLQYQKAAEDQARRDAEKKAAEEKFATDREAAYTAAQGTGRDVVTGRGLDYNEFESIINRALMDQKARIPQLDPNPATYFTSDIINNALTQEENQRRIRNTNQVNNEFAQGFDRTYIPDTADDSYINELLTGQKNQATQSLDFARKRGQLNDAGYNSAMGKLSEQEGGARSTLDTLGSSVLGKNRSSLSTIRDRASTGANTYSLGGPSFSLDPYRNELNSAVEGFNKNLKGDITNALGGTQLFNVNDILLSGARAQGPQNLTTANVPAILPKKNSQTDRGLGSTGQF
ncbi:hypothetical protein UFOVP1323_26 [uncultured Caudovirales phage]|uniref:Uncharacterized protein n=1 Tax=uncultured Caudovirales phage TaxID=2100421 RepID=A0A6J5RT02_9CAUD|nr:hypothetical protein UFOVP1323_26 [uncultured Caudovirales phage]